MRRMSAAEGFAEAERQFRQGRLREAEAAYRAILVRDPAFWDAMSGMGALCLRSGRASEAMAWFRRAAEGAPSAGRWNDLAVALTKAGRNEEAVTAYRMAVDLNPAEVRAWANMGRLLFSLGRKDEAVAALREAEHRCHAGPATDLCLGTAFLAVGQYEAAEGYLRKATQQAPDRPQLHYQLAWALYGFGQREKARDACRKALLLKPDYPEALELEGRIAYDLGRPDIALGCYRRLLALQPGSAKAHNHCGNALHRMSRFDEAADHFRQALAAYPQYADAAINLGNALIGAGHVDQALTAFETALSIDPTLANATLCRAESLQSLGRMEEAREGYARAVALAPQKPCYYRRMLSQSPRVRPGDAVIGALERLARGEAQMSAEDRAELHFALYRVCGDLDRLQEAFAHLAAGNAAKRSLIDYDEAAELASFRQVAETLPAALLQAKAGMGDPSELPVFVVGMPRSGTSLVEQILASHPEIYGAGEIIDFGAVVGDRSYRKVALDVAALSAAELASLGQRYVAGLRSRAPRARRIVDKLLWNFRQIGLIRLCLPNARIVHVMRDPMDTCFSCYTKLFRGTIDFSYDLGELARYYKAYRTLMAHWRAVLPEGAMYELRYEDLVTDFETKAHELLAYCGLPWDERCRNFHKTERAVQTASATQVRRPLYGNSIGRWKRYAQELEPLRKELDA